MAPSRRNPSISRSRSRRSDKRVNSTIGSGPPAREARRSGKRRGGEEGRSRWAPDHLKKKKDDRIVRDSRALPSALQCRTVAVSSSGLYVTAEPARRRDAEYLLYRSHHTLATN